MPQMSLDYIIRKAQNHAEALTEGGLRDSAMICLSDAKAIKDSDPTHARQRALASLSYSVGTLSVHYLHCYNGSYNWQ